MTSCVELRERRQALRDQIWLYGPEHFDMSFWGYIPSYLGELQTGSLLLREVANTIEDLNACGTTACLVGHAVKLNPHLKSEVAIVNYYGLSSKKGIATSDLFAVFFVRDWCLVEFSDGTTLSDHYESMIRDRQAYDVRVAEWRTIVDYLDDLIKNTECSEDVA